MDDEFFFQHSIISIPETLRELVTLVSTNIPFRKEIDSENVRMSDPPCESITLEECERLHAEILKLLIELDGFYARNLAPLEPDDVGYLEPLVLELKREVWALFSRNIAITWDRSAVCHESTHPLIVHPNLETSLLHLKELIQKCAPYFTALHQSTQITAPLESVRTTVEADAQSKEEESLLNASLRHNLEWIISETMLEAGTSTYANLEANDASLSKQALKLLDRLQDDGITYNEIACKRLILAHLFHQLELYDEAVAMSLLAVQVLRKLCASSFYTFAPYLVMAIHNYTRYRFLLHTVDGDVESVMQLCLEFNSEYQAAAPALPEYAHQLANSLTLFSVVNRKRRNSNKTTSHVEESIRILRQLLEMSTTSELYQEQTGLNGGAPSTFVNSTAHLQLIFDSASAFHELASHYKRDENWNSFVEAERQAVSQLEKLTPPTSHLPEPPCPKLASKANYLFHYAEHATNIKDPEICQRLEKAVALSRILAKRSKRGIIDLYHCLWEYARAVERAGSVQDSADIWMEIHNLAVHYLSGDALARAHNYYAWTLAFIGQDQESIPYQIDSIEIYRRRLSQNPPLKVAEGLTELTETLHRCGRSQEAIVTQLEAIHIYRANHVLDGLGSALVNCHLQLAECYLAIGAEDDARELCRRYPIETFESVASENQANQYGYFLRVNIACCAADTKPSSMEESNKFVQLLIKLYEKWPDQARFRLAIAYNSHGFKLGEHDRIQEAVKWVEDSLPWFEAQPTGAKFMVITNNFLSILINLADDCITLGKLSKALGYLDKALEMVKKGNLEDDPSSIPYVAGILLSRPDCLLSLGRAEEALAASALAVEYTESHTEHDLLDLAGALATDSCCLLFNNRPYDALSAAERSTSIAQGVNLKQVADQNPYGPLQLPVSLRALCDALADVGRHAEALERAEEASKALVDVRAWNLMMYSPSCPFAHQEEAWTALALGTCYFIGGEVARALKTFNEQIDSLSKRVGVEPGYYEAYCLLIRLSAWCLCALGSHDEGVDRIAEIDRLMQVIDPEQRLVVEVSFDGAAKRPSHIALWRDLNLQCGHQRL